MNKKQALNLTTDFVQGFPEGTAIVVIYQLPGKDTEVVSSIDNDRQLATGLREIAEKLSPSGDA